MPGHGRVEKTFAGGGEPAGGGFGGIGWGDSVLGRDIADEGGNPAWASASFSGKPELPKGVALAGGWRTGKGRLRRAWVGLVRNVVAMSGKKSKERVSVKADGEDLANNPFLALSGEGLPETEPSPVSIQPKPAPEKNLGKGARIEVRREKAGRGGKTVTTLRGFPPHLLRAEGRETLRDLKRSLGTGGVILKDRWELQGDRREAVVEWLGAKGFRPVLAGG